MREDGEKVLRDLVRNKIAADAWSSTKRRSAQSGREPGLIRGPALSLYFALASP